MRRIFISYRSPDVKDVEKLALELKNAGHEVWLAEWNIHPGDSIVSSISEGLARSNFLLLCVSKHSPSAWTDREWMSALARQLRGEAITIIPVLLSGSDLPILLSDIKYVDTRTDWHRGIEEILAAVGR